MPAETHQRAEAVTAADILDLLWAVLGAPDDRGAPDPSRALAELGIDDELAWIHLWDATVEEYGERALGEFDLDGARDATTLGELAEAFAHDHRRRDHNRGDSTEGTPR